MANIEATKQRARKAAESLGHFPGRFQRRVMAASGTLMYCVTWCEACTLAIFAYPNGSIDGTPTQKQCSKAEVKQTKETEIKTDTQELESLRVSIARVAQNLRIQSIILPVLKYYDIGELSKLAREQNRGWNALCGSIIGGIERYRDNDLHAFKRSVSLAMEYLSDNIHTLKDVESVLLIVGSIVPKRSGLHYAHALHAFDEPGDAASKIKAHLALVMKWIEAEERGLNDKTE